MAGWDGYNRSSQHAEFHRSHRIQMLKRLGAKIEKLAAEQPVLLAFLVFVAASLVVIPVALPWYLAHPSSMWQNILAEAHGTLFDLLVIGWFLLWLNKMAERRVQNNRYREEIDDYLGWQSPEATHRIAGSIRRLNRNGVTGGMRLTEAFLAGANLAGAGLQEADLWGANLEEAVLRETDLTFTNLAGADLQGADLERSNLSDADLRGATLEGADLERARMCRTDLRGASLNDVDLQYAVLENAQMERANLSGANLRGANLKGAVLKNADLENANLRGADFTGAELMGVNLTGADLLSATLVGAGLPEGDALLAVFENTKSLFGATFSPEIEQQLQDTYPGLFELADSRPSSDTTIEEAGRQDALQQEDENSAR